MAIIKETPHVVEGEGGFTFFVPIDLFHPLHTTNKLWMLMDETERAVGVGR